MSEIEKMYENAGIEKEFEKPAECTKNPYITCNGCMLYDDKKGKCNNRKEYPPFTAEKQLELIKWLAIKGDFDYTVDIAKNTDAYWTIYFDDSRWTAEEFEETLAGLINSKWQDLTDAEKQQIKEILE